jgi:hypothetical protein
MNLPARVVSNLCFAFLVTTVAVAQQPTPTPTPEAPQVAPSSPSSAPGAPPATPSPASNTDQQTTGTQQPASAQQAIQPAASGQEKQTETEKDIQKREQSQRILGVVPLFGMTSRHAPPPLSTGQKFHLFARSSFDPFEYAAAGFQAGLGQATNEFPGYGQGAEGYGKRFGASLADQVSSNFFANFFWPTLLKEDPRYFRLGEGSFKHRFFYSLAQEFVTRTDKGRRRFNFSNFFGAFSSGGLSNVYYPETDRGFSLTMSRSAISLLYGSAGGLIDEFWPDINRKVFHKHPKQAFQHSTTQPPN